MYVLFKICQNIPLATEPQPKLNPGIGLRNLPQNRPLAMEIELKNYFVGGTPLSVIHLGCCQVCALDHMQSGVQQNMVYIIGLKVCLSGLSETTFAESVLLDNYDISTIYKREKKGIVHLNLCWIENDNYAHGFHKLNWAA